MRSGVIRNTPDNFAMTRSGDLATLSARWVPVAAAVSSILVLGFGTSAAGGALRAERTPTWKIAFESDAGLDIVSSETPRPHPLLRHAAGENREDGVPAFSPDGLRVAYEHVSRRPGRDGLYVLDVAGGPGLRLARGDHIDDIAWSPDGTQIAFSRGWSSRDSGIYVVSSHGGAVRRIFPAGGFLAWSPDGAKLVCNCRRGLAVWVFDADGGRARRLTGPIGVLARAFWSPDGRQIAFGRHCLGAKDVRCDVAVMYADGTHKRTLLRSRVGGHEAFAGTTPFAVWASAQTLLVPAGGYQPHIGIYSVDVSSGRQRRISKHYGSLYPSASLAAFASIERSLSGETVLLLSPNGRILGRRHIPLAILGDQTVYVAPGY